MHSVVGSVLLTVTLDTHLVEFDSDNTLTLVRLMIQYFISLNKLNNTEYIAPRCPRELSALLL